MKYLPLYALTLVVAALLITKGYDLHTGQVTMDPLTERDSIAVWCAVHNKAAGLPGQAYIRSCTETNTP